MNKEKKAAFDKVATHYDNFMSFFQLNQWDHIIKWVTDHPWRDLLDVGGGTGVLASKFAAPGKNVVILDESTSMMARNPNNNIKWISGDAHSLPFNNNCFDTVLLTDVLHHLKDGKLAIQEIFRVLRPKGRLYLLDFNQKKFMVKLLGLFENLLFGKVEYMTIEKAEALAALFGRVTRKKKWGIYYLIEGTKDVL